MYSKVEYASWLNATNGFSESMRELVPSRNGPAALPLRPAGGCCEPADRKDDPDNRATAVPASSSLLIVERRFVHRQRPFVGVERNPDAQRNGSEVLAVPEGQLVENGTPRPARCLSRTSSIDLPRASPRPPAAGRRSRSPHVADDHARDPVELACVAELGQLAVDEVRRRVVSSKKRIAPRCRAPRACRWSA